MADVWYAVVEATGNLVSVGTVIADDAVLVEQEYTAVELPGNPAGMVWNPQTRAFDAAPTAHASYPKLAFIQRFTAEEFIALKSSADPHIQFFMYQLDHAIDITPQRANVLGALAYAVSLGLLTSGRATEIGAN